MPSLFGGGSTTVDTTPWEPQGDALRGIFSDATDLYNQGPTEYYQGDTVAGVNPYLQSAIDGMGNNSMGVGMANNAGNFANGQMNTGVNANNMVNSYLQDPNSMPTAGIDMNQVASFADNPYLNSQIDAANRDIGRNLSENTLNTIGVNSASSGNSGSSRRGVSEAIAGRDAMDRMADTSAMMRGNAYQDGMNKSMQLSQFNTSNQLNNLDRGVNMGNQGVNNSFNANNIMNQANQGAFTAGNLQRQIDQQNINADMDRFNYGQNADWANLNRYYDVIGANNWGGTSTTTNSGTIGQDLMALGSLAQGAGSLMYPTPTPAG